jgi:hypothetical protein
MKRDADDAEQGRMKRIKKTDFSQILFISGLIRVAPFPGGTQESTKTRDVLVC